MTSVDTKSAFGMKRPVLWLILVVAVASFADWTQNRLDERRSQEIKASMPPGAHLRISGSGPPTSTQMLLQLRYASGMIDTAKKNQQSAFVLGNNSAETGDQDLDDQRRSTFDRLTGSRTGRDSSGFGNQSSQFSSDPFSPSRNSFSSSSADPFALPQSNPYSSSPNSTFSQDPNASRRNSGRDTEPASGIFSPDPN